MNILQGVDLVEIEKFREVFARHPRFSEELFTEGERSYCEGRLDAPASFAGRFAAKEAALKALGVGITTGIDRALREVEIVRTGSGKPTLRFHGWVLTLSERLGVSDASVSLSHSGSYAMASVILVSDARERGNAG